jgi:Zn-dependent M28 family amino/carboxypeptidase
VIPPGPDPSTSNAGCEPEDFTGFTPGNVALIQRGTCTLGTKVANATAAGASGVVLFNEGQPGRTDAFGVTLGGPATIPVVFASFAIGEALYAQFQAGDPVAVHLVTSTLSEERTTWNVLADTRRGDANHTIVLGGHLDSVVPGPGINDNGSGSAMILEFAEELAEMHARPANRVRFAFWGAEESGLLGSQNYVDTLPADQLAQIALNLNFDMVGSDNFVHFVYDGDGSATGTAGPPGSAEIEQQFLDYFASQGLPVEPTAFDGRSDYGPFIAVGIPAGGLFTGADGLKTPEQVATYGGRAGEQYDPCYHQACDVLAGVNRVALDQMSDAAATATWVWAHGTPPSRVSGETTARVAAAASPSGPTAGS